MGTTEFARRAMLLAPSIFCVLVATSVQAVELRLTLPQAIDYSLQNNGDLKALRHEKGIRDAGKVRAGLLPNPSLNLEVGTGALTGSGSESNLSLGVSQEFFLAGKREKRLAVAERELEMYRWQVADRERTLREEVRTAFYDVILAEQRITLADRYIGLSKQLLDVARERLTAGDIPELEVNLVKVELARSEGAKIEVAKILLQTRAKLMTIMGLPQGEQPVVSGDLEYASNLTKTLAELKQFAFEQRPDLKFLRSEKNKDESKIVLAKAEGVPNITAGLAVTREATSVEFGGAEHKDTDYIVGVTFSIPIPVFDHNQAGIKEAKATRNSSESRLLSGIRNVEREVEIAYAGYQNAERVLGLYRSDIIPQLEENLELTRESYRLGEVGVLAVIQEQKKFFELKEGYLTALHERQAVLAKLESTVATDLTGGVQ